MAWRIIDSEGTVWKREEDTTTAEVVTVCEILENDTWQAAAPIQGPKALTAWVVMLTAQRSGIPILDATELVFKLPFETVADMLKVE